jgi:hypothetical protein
MRLTIFTEMVASEEKRLGEKKQRETAGKA